MYEPHTPQRLFLRLLIYFSVLAASIAFLTSFRPELLQSLPITGIDAFDAGQIELEQDPSNLLGKDGHYDGRRSLNLTGGKAGAMAMFLGVSLLLTVMLMIPVTWTYMATRQDAGFRKTFVRLLIALPICATTIVLLIQNSLALAFGLAALVAAVRFRVSLQDPIDGIYIFAAICVGLSAGIGYMGIASVMVLFFCFANAFLWSIDYGRNPLDDARAAKDRAKLKLKTDKDFS